MGHALVLLAAAVLTIAGVSVLAYRDERRRKAAMLRALGRAERDSRHRQFWTKVAENYRNQ